jgi:aspartyl-tRNA(Asn)/glutamyl-tRNA(Gln) amidotransferase subunit C
MKIDDRLIDYIGDLSRLYMSAEEKEARRGDLSDILDYIEKLNELDTDGVPELTHPFSANNVFRDDAVLNADRAEEMLANAPEVKGRYFKVLRAVEE